MDELLDPEILENELVYFEEGMKYALNKWNKVMYIFSLENHDENSDLCEIIKEDTLKQIEFYRKMIDSRKELIKTLKGHS